MRGEERVECGLGEAGEEWKVMDMFVGDKEVRMVKTETNAATMMSRA